MVFNPNSAAACDVVTFACPDGLARPAVYDGGQELPVQKAADGSWMFTASGVPGKGYKTFRLAEASRKDPETMTVSDKVMENVYFLLTFDENGQFDRIYDKRAGREVLKPGQKGNVLVSYEDRPHNFDAWDVNHYYTEKSWEISSLDALEVVENGPVRGTVKLVRHYLDSEIVQYISIYQDIPRIDIRNEIDWKEHLIFLKDYFPVDVHTDEATFDIQYGNVKRPTHENTSWDMAKFEVCHHKWLDVSEDGYGVSVLNDCKYGASVRDGVIGLSMLKSALYPNPEADKEHHTFTYSIYPHSQGWREAGTVKQAYQINNPLTAVVKENEGGSQPETFSYVSCDSDNVVVEVVKKAEEGSDVIVRLYECFNRRTTAQLTFGETPAQVWSCDMLENKEEQIKADGNRVEITMKPYEIRTLRLVF